MGVGAWILLIAVGLGIPATLVYLLSIPASAAKSLPTQPVWVVLLDGGTNGRERPYSPEDAPDHGSNCQAPPSPQDGHEIAVGSKKRC